VILKSWQKLLDPPLGSTEAIVILKKMQAQILTALSTAVVVAMLGSMPTKAQSFYGSITGTVHDPSGAVLPGVTIKSTNTATSTQRNTTTDTNGDYRFVDLIPGNYRLDFEIASFKHLSRPNVRVEVQSIARIDAVLEIGSTSSTVEVNEAPPMLQTETASLGHVIEQPQNMPLNGRNVLALTTLIPGVVAQGQAGVNPSNVNNTSRGNFQIDGGLANTNAEFIDGAPVNVNYISMLALVPTQDAIQEFQVQSNSLSSEFGRYSGGVINLTTRSGSNQFHGAVYEYLRNEILNANTYFSKRANLPVPPYKQNQYGARLGGPILRDKLFFFGSWEGYRQRQAGTNTATIPLPAFVQGDFSNLKDSNGNTIPIYDPLTTCGTLTNPACATDANGNPIYTRQAFPGNKIPSNRLDPTAVLLAPMIWQAPNQPGLLTNNYVRNFPQGANNQQYNGRIDWNVSAKQRFFGRYTYWPVERLAIEPLGLPTQGPITEHVHQFVFGDTYTINPTTIADLRVSYLRYTFFQQMVSLGMDLTKIGWPASYNNLPNHTMPFPVISGYSGFDGSQVSIIGDKNNLYSMAGSLSKFVNKHNFKMGFDLRRLEFWYTQTNYSSGQFSFDRGFTALNPQNPGSTGNSFASYMLGNGSGGSVWINIPAYGIEQYYAIYLNDDYRVTPRLTMNLGMRWDFPVGWSERQDRNVVLLPNAASPLGAQTGLPLQGKMALVNSSDWPSRNSYANRHNLFGPRFGINYQMMKDTVLRAGFGISFLPLSSNLSTAPSSSPVMSNYTSWVSTLDGGLTPNATLNSPFPTGFLLPLGHNPAFQTQLYGQSVGGVTPKSSQGYYEQWNVAIERSISPQTSLEVAYAGSAGVKVPFNVAMDELPDQYLSMGAQLQQQVANPFYGYITSGALAGPKIQRGQLLRPFPQYTAVTGRSSAEGHTVYHALQAKFQRRFGSAGTLLGAYTWSKLISNAETLTPWNEGNVGNSVGSPQDYNNLGAERSVSANDVPQNLVISYTYGLPFGNGRALLGGAQGIGNSIISGWNVGGITSFRSGLPLAITDAVNNSFAYGGSQRPNLVPGCAIARSGSGTSRLSQWFNTSCFTQPAPFTFGNAPRELAGVRSSGTNNWDVFFSKTTHLHENLGLEFRAELFNLFDRVQFSEAGQSFGAGNFGLVSGQQNNPRLVQFALRLEF